MTKPLFDELCSARLGKAVDLCNQRGSEYGDTLRHNQWLIARATAKKLGFDLTSKQARAICIAGLCDIKYQRFEGGFKEDNIDDGINYQSVLPGLIAEAEAK